MLTRFCALIRSGTADLADLDAALLGQVHTSALQPGDFDHLAAERDHAVRLLRSQATARSPGIHLLLYGPPGTGKTELAGVLAAAAGLELHAIGEDANGAEPSRTDRVGALRLAYAILRSRTGVAVLVDEGEDLLGGSPFEGFPWSRGGSGSRVYVHRLLEQASVPTIWTVNAAEALGGPILRRMSLAIPVRTPPRAARRRLWQRTLASTTIDCDEAAVSRLAQDRRVSPAIAALAIRSVQAMQGSGDDLRRAAESIADVVHADDPRRPETPSAETAFDPELSNTSTSLAELTAALAGAEVGTGFSLCLYGPPGTGKSAYARCLAASRGMPVIERRVSDLVSKWVGDTEKAIALAFEEARDEEAFLLFDEADSLLRSREQSRHSWEVTQVNEMLTWMERHPFPFACTTNAFETLDPAALRRFTIRVRFDHLDQEGARRAWRRFLPGDPPPGLDRLTTLTAADFALAARRAGILGRGHDRDRLLDLLADEAAAKPAATRPIGFLSPV